MNRKYGDAHYLVSAHLLEKCFKKQALIHEELLIYVVSSGVMCDIRGMKPTTAETRLRDLERMYMIETGKEAVDKVKHSGDIRSVWRISVGFVQFLMEKQKKYFEEKKEKCIDFLK